jgi:hypothetical protein
MLYSNRKPEYQLAENNCTQRPIIFLNKMGLRPEMNFNVVCNPVDKNKPAFIYRDDARTKDGFRGEILELDAPAKIGCIGIDETFYAANSNYKLGPSYKGYRDLNNGQISYYQDATLIKPFNGMGGVYTLSSNVESAMLVDPMGANLPQYYKTPISSTLNSVSKDQATRDALYHREDLMSRQQSLYNRTDWSYYNN